MVRLSMLLYYFRLLLCIYHIMGLMIRLFPNPGELWEFPFNTTSLKAGATRTVGGQVRGLFCSSTH